MRLPDFLIIGAQKSGTTWLAAQLRRHPDIFVHRGEVHYFDKDFNQERGLGWYASHFADAGPVRAVGEKTPDYLWAEGRPVGGHLPDVHLRIHGTLPDARLIVVLRDPVWRAVSAVNHVLRHGRISPLRSVDDLLLGRKANLLKNHPVLEKGLYAPQLRAYLELFPRDQLLVLIFEEHVVERPREGLERTCRFLGVDPTFEFQELKKKRNAGRNSWLRLVLDYHLPLARSRTWRLDRYLPRWEARPAARTVARLREYYRQPNRELFALLGFRPASWEGAKDVTEIRKGRSANPRQSIAR